jgi:hypothetical protein
MTPQDIIAKALESSGLDRDDVESMSRFLPTRFHSFTDAWEVGQPTPAPGYITFAIFIHPSYDPVDANLPGDVRLYCVPAPTNPNASPVVFVLNRTSPSAFQAPFRPLTEDQFSEVIGEEWASLAEAISLFDEDEEEGVECPACKRSTTIASEDEDAEDVPKFCGHCGAHLPAVVVEAVQ